MLQASFSWSRHFKEKINRQVANEDKSSQDLWKGMLKRVYHVTVYRYFLVLINFICTVMVKCYCMMQISDQGCMYYFINQDECTCACKEKGVKIKYKYILIACLNLS